MSTGYVKVFGSLLDSSVWQESHATRIVWVTMMAMANQDGEVLSSIPGLARRAGVSIEECEAALKIFLSPDKYSASPIDEGRRIRPIRGGWELVNHEFYKNKLSAEDRRERTRKRVEKHRSKNSGVTEPVTLCNAEALHVTPVTLCNASNDMQITSGSASASELSSQGGVGGSGGSGDGDVFTSAHPDFVEPEPTRPDNPRPPESQASSRLLRSPPQGMTELQFAAERMRRGGSHAQNVVFERGLAHRWPEVQRLIEFDAELLGDVAPPPPRRDDDSRVEQILERFRDGMTVERIEDVIRRARESEFWGQAGLHSILKQPANFPGMGKKQRVANGEQYTRAPGDPIVVSEAEAARYR